MLASTSSVRGVSVFNDPYHFFNRQVVWLVLSLAVGMGLTRFDYHWWRKLALPLAIVSIITLVLVFIPGIGLEVNGSRRWLRAGPMSVQPSELAKFASIVGLSAWMAHIGKGAQRFVDGLARPLIFLGVVLGLIIIEPDFGTTLLVAVVGMLIMFAGGTRISYLVSTGSLGVMGFLLAIMQDHRRWVRIMAYRYPEQYPKSAYHLLQSKHALIAGGFTGVGLGDSIQKRHYLPENHTDFIFAIVGEECGFLGTACVVGLFAGLLVCGMLISLKAPDPFGRLLAFGLTMMLVLQASINIAVVTGCLPTKGLPLPFISYGGSSLLMSVALVGVLLNVARHGTKEHVDSHTITIKDKAHRF